jgi:hypothetical protein
MELKALKLLVINQILETQDPAVLQTVANLLSASAGSGFNAEPFTPGEMAGENYMAPFSEENTRDLQKSIDEFFNP